jgi:membrane protein required for colicin V production
MTALDIIVLLLVGWFGVRGLQNGFVTESLSLAAWVVAIIAVKTFHGPTAAALTNRVGTASGASVLAFALLFGGTFLIGRIIANRIGRASKSSVLGAFDRALGVGFGALKGLIGASVLFLFASLLYDTVFGGKSERPGWMVESRTYPLLNATSRALVDFVDERRKNGGDAAPKSS